MALASNPLGSQVHGISVQCTQQLNPAWASAVAGFLIGLSLLGPVWSALVWPALLLWSMAMHVCCSRRQEAASIALGVLAWSSAGSCWVAAAVREDSEARLLWQLLTMLASVLHHLVCVMLPWMLARWRMPSATTATWRLVAWAVALSSGEAWRQWGWAGHGYVSLAEPMSAWAGAALPLSLVGGLGLTAMGCSAAAAAAGWLAAPNRSSAVRTAVGATLLLPMLHVLAPPPDNTADTSTRIDGWRVVALATQLDRSQAFSWQERDRLLAALDQAMGMAGAGQMVVTPETYFAEPPPQEAQGVWADLLQRVDSSGATLLVGMPHVLRDPAGVQIINSALQLAPARTSLYGKRRLVAFGEYLPWSSMMGWVYQQVFASARDGQRPAPDELVQPLFAAGRSVGVLICHEMSFALEAAERAQSADWLVVLSEDGWIRHPMYRQQMIALARLRAMETGQPLLRVANGGPTLLAEPNGRVHLMPAMQADSLQPWPVVVPFGGAASPYARSATLQWWSVALAPLALALGLTLRRCPHPLKGVPA